MNLFAHPHHHHHGTFAIRELLLLWLIFILDVVTSSSASSWSSSSLTAQQSSLPAFHKHHQQQQQQRNAGRITNKGSNFQHEHAIDQSMSSSLSSSSFLSPIFSVGAFQKRARRRKNRSCATQLFLSSSSSSSSKVDMDNNKNNDDDDHEEDDLRELYKTVAEQDPEWFEKFVLNVLGKDDMAARLDGVVDLDDIIQKEPVDADTGSVVVVDPKIKDLKESQDKGRPAETMDRLDRIQSDNSLKRSSIVENYNDTQESSSRLGAAEPAALSTVTAADTASKKADETIVNKDTIVTNDLISTPRPGTNGDASVRQLSDRQTAMDSKVVEPTQKEIAVEKIPEKEKVIPSTKRDGEPTSSAAVVEQRMVVFKEPLARSWTRVPLLRFLDLGYREVDVVSLDPRALESIASGGIRRPRSGIPQRWKISKTDKLSVVQIIAAAVDDDVDSMEQESPAAASSATKKPAVTEATNEKQSSTMKNEAAPMRGKEERVSSGKSKGLDPETTAKASAPMSATKPLDQKAAVSKLFADPATGTERSAARSEVPSSQAAARASEPFINDPGANMFDEDRRVGSSSTEARRKVPQKEQQQQKRRPEEEPTRQQKAPRPEATGTSSPPAARRQRIPPQGTDDEDRSPARRRQVYDGRSTVGRGAAQNRSRGVGAVKERPDPPPPSGLWPDLDSFRSMLRNEASLRLRILGDDWSDAVKDESDWRLNLYKEWLWTLHNGVGDPIVESPSDRQRRRERERRRMEEELRNSRKRRPPPPPQSPRSQYSSSQQQRRRRPRDDELFEDDYES